MALSLIRPTVLQILKKTALSLFLSPAAILILLCYLPPVKCALNARLRAFLVSFCTRYASRNKKPHWKPRQRGFFLPVGYAARDFLKKPFFITGACYG
jgi:hypothetical protein